MDYRETINNLKDYARRELQNRYGPDSETHLPYHNIDHSEEVAEAAEKIGREKGLSDRVCDLLAIAGLYHDIEHRQGPEQDEKLITEEAVEQLRQAGDFTEDEEKTLFNGIIATTIRKIGDKILQSVGTNTIFDSIVADADLSYFGQTRERFMTTLNKYYQEKNPGALFDSDTYYAFVQSTIEFMEGHSFITPEACKLYPFKDENIAMLKQWLQEKRTPSAEN